MKERTETNYVDYGCGFPVVIDEVRVRKNHHGEIPLIDYNLLQQKVLQALIAKQTRLSGNEVKFIRLYFRFTLQAFAALLKVSHPAVSKWENRTDDPTNMNPATEILLRLYVQHKLGTRSSDFLRRFQWLMATIGDEGMHESVSEPISVSGVSPGGDPRHAQRVVG